MEEQVAISKRRRKRKEGTNSASPNARMKLTLRILLGDNIAMGPGKADLLEAIEKTGSISAAGRSIEMSYRRAWLLVDEMNRCFKSPLVTAAKGGAHGGGTQLTAAGKKVLEQYRQVESATKQLAAAYFIVFQDLLAETPAPATKAKAELDGEEH